MTLLSRIVGLLLAVIGGAGFLMPFVIDFFDPHAENIELPLSDVSDVDVSTDGVIFIALNHSGRIQKYTSDGDFMRNFSVDNYGGIFCIEIIDDLVEVDIARKGTIDYHDLSGNYVKSTDTKGGEVSNCNLGTQITSVERKLDRVTILLADSSKLVTIIRQTWHYLAYNAFISWLMIVIGLFLIPEWRRGIFSKGKKSEYESRK